MSHPLITLLAEGPANTGPDFGKASPVGLFIVLLLLVGVFALVWSMNRHLKRVPASFETDPDTDTPVGDATDPDATADTSRSSEEEPSG